MDLQYSVYNNLTRSFKELHFMSNRMPNILQLKDNKKCTLMLTTYLCSYVLLALTFTVESHEEDTSRLSWRHKAETASSWASRVCSVWPNSKLYMYLQLNHVKQMIMRPIWYLHDFHPIEKLHRFKYAQCKTICLYLYYLLKQGIKKIFNLL